jgi:hypothetical protein
MHEEYDLGRGSSVVPVEIVEREFRGFLERLGEDPSQKGVVSMALIFFAGGAAAPLQLVSEGRWQKSNVGRLGGHWGNNLGGGTNLYQPLLVAFRDTDADTVVFFTDGAAVTGRYTTPEGLAGEIETWNRGRGTRIVTLGPRPIPPSPGIPQVPTILQRLVDVTDGTQLYFEECFAH